MKLKKTVTGALIAFAVVFTGIVGFGLLFGSDESPLVVNGVVVEDGTTVGGENAPVVGSDGSIVGQPGGSNDGSTSGDQSMSSDGGSTSSGTGSGSSGSGSSGGSSGGNTGGSSGGSSGGGSSGGGGTTTPPPSTPPPPAPACGSGGSCTASQVASHNTQSNCWVIYNGKVYNVTGFVSKHPGGRSVFNSNTCGRDISTYLNGTREPTSGEQHKHSSGDISDINPYFIANLS